jgi:hypothetical protein
LHYRGLGKMRSVEQALIESLEVLTSENRSGIEWGK